LSRGDLSGDEVAACPRLFERAEAAGVSYRPRATTEPIADVVARAVLRLAGEADRLGQAPTDDDDETDVELEDNDETPKGATYDDVPF
jgi:hypothetical protein